jgi:hypothetical protein
MKASLAEMIESKKRQLANAPPHSRRRHHIWYQLHELMLRELRKEIREDRKAA